MSWTAAEAEAHLDSLALHGWRFGLERMHRLLSVMGLPQNRFASIHVVGSNGKSSTARMIAAILEAHGVPTGAYLSPHISSWRERIELGGEPIEGEALAAAVESAAEAARMVERSLDEGDFVTQFELATGAAFQAFVAARVEVAVVEAGLGGRLDATNVIPSRVAALTSVDLEHTDWLGESEAEIAAEKLAVVRDRSTLVCGRLDGELADLAARTAAERHAALVSAEPDPGPDIRLAAPGAHQRRNFAVAMAAARAILGELDPPSLERAARVRLPGRLELLGGDPPMLVDAAHNPAAMRALAETLPELTRGRPVTGCVAVLADKDAAAMLAVLAPHCARLVCTEVGGERGLPASELARLAGTSGPAPTEAERDPGRALERARELARKDAGVALVTGSHYLLQQLWSAGPDRS